MARSRPRVRPSREFFERNGSSDERCARILALLELDAPAALMPSDIARRLRLEPSSLAGPLARLKDEGAIERTEGGRWHATMA